MPRICHLNHMFRGIVLNYFGHAEESKIFLNRSVKEGSKCQADKSKELL